MKMNGVGAIVTGAASGLGAAAADALTRGGAKVTIVDRDVELGHAQARAIGGHFVQADVVDSQSVEEALCSAERQHGVTRILVNCAGIGVAIKTVGKEGTAHPIDSFQKTIAVNLLGTFNMLSQFAARLSRAERIGEERGVIVNTASVAAFEGQIGQVAYAASKGGVVAMTLPAARDLSQFAIRVCTIAPGIFWTPMLATLSEAALASLGQQVPFPPRLGQPPEFAQLVCSIVENPMLNGETIRLDGALRMAPR
jgi:NAD(P)-dependent dehydrogenase (short-subunit alcohol dehydrogenase family)